jgi:hypothetical protein
MGDSSMDTSLPNVAVAAVAYLVSLGGEKNKLSIKHAPGSIQFEIPIHSFPISSTLLYCTVLTRVSLNDIEGWVIETIHFFIDFQSTILNPTPLEKEITPPMCTQVQVSIVL